MKTVIAFATILAVLLNTAHGQENKTQTSGGQRLAVLDYNDLVRSNNVNTSHVAMKWLSSSVVCSTVGASALLVSYLNSDSGKKQVADISSRVARYFKEQGKVTTNDVDNIRQIIQAGKVNNVDEMRILVNRDQFLGLKGGFQHPAATVTLEGGASGSTHYEIVVKYKVSESPTTPSSAP